MFSSTQLARLRRAALHVAVAAATLGAGLPLASAASAEVLLARSECIDGYWHVVTYDVSNPNAWVKTSDEKTSQSCGDARALEEVTVEAQRRPIRTPYKLDPPTFRPTLRYQWQETKPEPRPTLPMRYAW